MIDGLGGAASDVIGRVTPASLYAHVDQTLGAWEQRPIYKANVQSFISLREVSLKVPKEILRRLPKYFPTASHVLKLDPSFEPDRGEEAERLKDVPVDEDNVRIYRELQKCHQHGLITPTDHEYMWHTAVFWPEHLRIDVHGKPLFVQAMAPSNSSAAVPGNAEAVSRA